MNTPAIMESNSLELCKSEWKYCAELAEEVVENLLKGRTLNSICKEDAMPGMPVLMKWMAQVPHFKEAVTLAQAGRAQMMIDSAVDLVQKYVDELPSKDEAPGFNAVVNSAIRLAEKLDTVRFGTKHVESTNNTPTQINIISHVDKNPTDITIKEMVKDRKNAGKHRDSIPTETVPTTTAQGTEEI